MEDPESLPMPPHPFAELIGLHFEPQPAGRSQCALTVAEHHLNPHRVVHGAVIFALADTGMGAALYPTLAPGESCATIEIRIAYFRPVIEGLIRCETELVHRGRNVVHLLSRIHLGDALVAQANGSYSVFTPRPRNA